MLGVVVLAAGCGVRLADDPTAHGLTDASPTAADAASVIHADAAVPADARPCAGGNLAEAGPNNTCFVFFNTPSTWAAAKAACIAFNSHLAILDSAAADLVAESMLTVDAFIGATDAAVEGTFLWVDSSPLTYTNWHTGEPNNGNGNYQEDCVVVAGARVGKQWDDRPCGPEPGTTAGMYPYLCEY